MSKATAAEKVELLRAAMQALKLIGGADVLAGVILVENTYDNIRDLFGPSAEQHVPAGLVYDPNREQAFVVDGVLFLRGTTMQ